MLVNDVQKKLGRLLSSTVGVTRVVLGVIISLVLSIAVVQAQTPSVPQLVNYQGNLTDATGLPLASGRYTLEFNIYDTAGGNNLVWGPQVFDDATATGHGSKVSVVSGYFNVILGPVDTGNRPLSAAFSGGCQVFS